MAEEERGILSELAIYGQSGMTFVASVCVGFGMGWYLDNKLFAGRTSPWFTFIFLCFGIAAGFRHLWELNKRISRDE